MHDVMQADVSLSEGMFCELKDGRPCSLLFGDGLFHPNVFFWKANTLVSMLRPSFFLKKCCKVDDSHYKTI